MKKALVLLLALFIGSGIIAQEKENKYGFGLGFVPQYTFINGLRIDLDIKINKDKQYWLIFSPQYYYDKNDYVSDNYYYSYDYRTLTGFGMDIAFKKFLNSNNIPKGPHFTAGLTFQYFSVEKSVYEPVEFWEDGVKYFTEEVVFKRNPMYKIGPNLLIGYQFVIEKILFVDIYGGTGFRISADNQDGEVTESLSEWWGDYGYSGILLNGGVRIGIFL